MDALRSYTDMEVVLNPKPLRSYTDMEVVFQTGPTQVVLTAPADEAAGVGPDVLHQWEAFPDAEFYRVRAFEDDAGSPGTQVIDKVVNAIELQELLTESTTYHWNVRVTNRQSPTPPSSVDSVTITGGTTLEQNGTRQLSVTVETTGDIDDSVTWSSSDDGVATVDSNGLVTYVSGAVDATVTITATAVEDNQVSDDHVLTIIAESDSVDSQAGDEAALQALYTSTNGATWDDNTGWNGGAVDLSNPPAHVVTEQINGEWRVRQINLHHPSGFVPETRGVLPDGSNWGDYTGGNGLTGTFPDEMRNLKKLTHLRVKGNSMTGRIDHFVQSLESAVHLEFSAPSGQNAQSVVLHEDYVAYNHPGKDNNAPNRFTGPIPDLDMLVNLVVFQAAGSEFSGSLPQNLPSSIKFISLQQNHLTGTLPAWSNCNPTHLYLTNRQSPGQFTGEVPQSYTGFTEMRWFRIGGNDLSGEFPWMDQWYDVRLFDVVDNGNTNLGGPFPDWLFDTAGKHENLHTFQISAGFYGEITAVRGNSGRISVFSFTSSQVGGVVPDWVWTETNSVQFVLSANQFTGGVRSDFLDYMDRAKIFRMDGNSFTGSLPSGQWWDGLDDVRFQNNQFTGSIPASWESMKVFTPRSERMEIMLNNNLLEGLIPEFLKDIGSEGGATFILNLSNNKFTPKDILPHRTAIQNAPQIVSADDYVYLPQKPFGQANQQHSVGDTLDLSSFEYTNQTYQWYRSGVLLTGEESSSIDTTTHGAGEYVLRINHPDIDFEFQSEEITVE